MRRKKGRKGGKEEVCRQDSSVVKKPVAKPEDPSLELKPQNSHG